MHVFLFEWATGGGLVHEPGGIPLSLVREGAAMVGALAADLVRIADCRVTAFRDLRMLDLSLPRCEIIDVQSRAGRDEDFARLCSMADVTVIIAPEFDEILLNTASEVVRRNGRLCSPSPEFIRLTANKQATAERLSDTGIPTPVAVVMEPDAHLPNDFSYPAVLKPIDGTGSQDTQLVTSASDELHPYPWPRRLEEYCVGLPASVAAICGPAGHRTLPPCEQRISTDGRLRYLGGGLPLLDGLAARATKLAERTITALPPATGYIGIDMILGREPDGTADFVLEVNPRLTTSYVGLRAACQSNLAEAMINIARGCMPELPFSSRPLAFDCEGRVSYV
jgi:predicted ATP-grasp superfamily ATP-dependent carboligase